MTVAVVLVQKKVTRRLY